MSLQNTILNSVDTAFNALGDLAINATLVVETSAYDPDTSVVTKTESEIEVDAVITEDDSTYMDLSAVPVHDMTLLIKYGSFSVSLGDSLVIQTETYEIVGFQLVRAGSAVVMYVLWVKK